MTFVLSLDGGGIRGVLTAELLRRTEQQRPFLSRVDVFAGTSTGGILALGLARGLTPAQLVEFYVEHGKAIFGPRDAIDRLAGPADELVRADYDNAVLAKILNDKFGSGTLGDLNKTVVIPTFDLDNEAAPRHNWKPKFLHNFTREGNDGIVNVVDAALRTSAAPTYFPSYQGFIDGGVAANNPSMCAVASVVKSGVPLGQVRVLSLGTGFNPHAIPGERHDWGKSQWMTHIVKLLMDGMSGIADYQCTQLLGSRYRRLDVALDEVVELDDAKQVERLVAIAGQAPIDDTVRWLDAQLGG